MTDNLAGAGAAVRLRELGVAGKRIDNVAGEVGAIGRCQRGALFALEVIMQHQFVVVPGKDQVDAGALEVAVEQQLRVRDNYRACRNMRGVVGKSLDVALPIGMQARAIDRQIGIEFAGVIQMGPRQKLIFI